MMYRRRYVYLEGVCTLPRNFDIPKVQHHRDATCSWLCSKTKTKLKITHTYMCAHIHHT